MAGVKFSIFAVDKTKAAFRSVKKSLGNVQGALGAISAVLVTGKILKYADAWKETQGKLKLVTKSTAELTFVTGQLFKSAQENRVSFTATAQLYQRVARFQDQLGVSTKETIKFTDLISKSIRISGSTAQEASSGMLQLAQAMGAGRLMGDEFRSVSENMPRVMQALSKHLNVPIGDLKEMSKNGLITSKVLMDAMMSSADAIQEEFSQVPLTVSQGFQVLENSFIKFIGDLDTSSGLTNILSEAMVFLGENLEIIARLIGSVAIAALMSYSKVITAAVVPALKAAIINVRAFTSVLMANPLGLIISLLQIATVNVRAFASALMASPLGAITKLLQLATIALVAFGDEFKPVQDKQATFLDYVRAAWDWIADKVMIVVNFLMHLWKKFIGFVAKGIDWLLDKFESFINGLIDIYNDVVGLFGSDPFENVELTSLTDAASGVFEGWSDAAEAIAKARKEKENFMKTSSGATGGNLPSVSTPGVPTTISGVNTNDDANSVGIDLLKGFEDQVTQTQQKVEDLWLDSIFGVEGQFEKSGNKIKDIFKDLGRSFLSNVIDKISKATNSGGGFGSIFDSVAGMFTGGSTGGGIGGLLGVAGSGGGVLSSTTSIFGGGMVSGSGGGLGGILSSFGGFFADGGDFKGGKPIVVGERGAEVIMPKSSGTVVPNEMLGGSTNINFTVNANDAGSFRKAQGQIMADLQRSIDRGRRNM